MMDVAQMRDFEGVVAIVSTSYSRQAAGATWLIPLGLIVAAESTDAPKGCQCGLRSPSWDGTGAIRLTIEALTLRIELAGPIPAKADAFNGTTEAGATRVRYAWTACGNNWLVICDATGAGERVSSLRRGTRVDAVATA
jgi:hypothetical protein